jgi:hypothetical protein
MNSKQLAIEILNIEKSDPNRPRKIFKLITDDVELLIEEMKLVKKDVAVFRIIDEYANKWQAVSNRMPDQEFSFEVAFLNVFYSNFCSDKDPLYGSRAAEVYFENYYRHSRYAWVKEHLAINLKALKG